MLYNTMSHYPDGIDEMIFFQDNDLETIEIMNHYNDLISKCKYTEANEYITNQEGIHGFYADLFNAIENRIYNLQKYILTKPPKKQLFVFAEADSMEPDISTLENNIIWS